MDRTLLLTDSNVCLSRGTSRRLGIRIVPITILLDGASVADDSIDPAVVFRAIAHDDTVKSSPPSVIDYLTAIEDDGYSGALVLTPAAEFTSMFLHATQAAGLSSRPVRVVDTRTAAAAQRLVVLEVHAACRRGARLEDLEQIARDAAGRVELVATLDRVATIERSGRVPAPVLAAADRGDGFQRVPVPRWERDAAAEGRRRPARRGARRVGSERRSRLVGIVRVPRRGTRPRPHAAAPDSPGGSP